MPQIIERLEMPAEMYRDIEEIGKSQGQTALQVVEGWLNQYQMTANLPSLRQEYQRLIRKDLNRTLSAQEVERLEKVCEQINTIEMQIKAGHLQKSFAQIDAELLEIQRQIESYPEMEIGEGQS